MARTKQQIDKAELTAELNRLEASKTWENPSALYAAAAVKFGCSHATIYLRVKEFGITLNTKAGRKGGPMTQERIQKMQEGRKGKRSRGEKLAAFADKTYGPLRQEYTVELSRAEKTGDVSSAGALRIALKLVDRAEKGSIRAALGLKCLDCSNLDRAEIRHCQITNCILYPLRPYQASEEEEPEDEEVEVAVA